MYYIYKITNKINGKIYIGQTCKPIQRWAQYKSAAKRHINDQLVVRSIIKHGAENFLFEIIATCNSQENVNITEVEIIKQYNSRNLNIGYNIDYGGDVSPRPPEIAKKISASLKKYYQIHESTLKGIKFSEERKKNLSIASIGKSGTNTGKKFDDNWKKKMSRSLSSKERKDSRKFNEETELEICRLYKEEKSTYWLAQQFKCVRGTISAILNRHNITKRISNYTGHKNNCNKFTLEQELEICELYKNTNSTRKDLAKKFNCGSTTVRDILLRNGVKL